MLSVAVSKNPLKWSLSGVGSYGAIFFVLAWGDFTCWGFDNTMWKKIVWIFNQDVITQKESSNSEMYSCWDSEHAGFSENGGFTVRRINDNWKLCKNRNMQKQLFCKKLSTMIFCVGVSSQWKTVNLMRLSVTQYFLKWKPGLYGLSFTIY